jgi:hypothetical protein
VKPKLFSLDLSGGLDYANAYLHRGYLHQDGGLLLEPYGTVGGTWNGPDKLTVSPYFTAWSSFQLDGRATIGPDGGAHVGYRTPIFIPASLQRYFGSSPFPSGPSDDWYLGELTWGTVSNWRNFTFDLSYQMYTFPTGPAIGIQEVGGKIRYDLGALWRDPTAEPTFGLRPSVSLYREILDRYDAFRIKHDHFEDQDIL